MTKDTGPATVSWAGRVVHLILLLVTFASFIALAQYLPLKLAGTIQMGRGDPMDVLVLPGMNAREISRVFGSSGLTDRPNELSRWFAREGIDRSIRPGLYRIRKGSPWEIARQMAVAEPEVSGITLYPGETYEVLLARLGETFEGSLQGMTSSRIRCAPSFHQGQVRGSPFSSPRPTVLLLPMEPSTNWSGQPRRSG